MMRRVEVPSLGRRGEGWVVLQSIVILAIGFAGTIWHGDGETPLGRLATWVGLALLLAGVGFAGWAIIGLSRARAMTVVPEPLATGRLVTTGAHGIVRHPVYLGIVLAAIGYGIARLSAPAVVVALVLLLVFDLKRRREERWLIARYPEYAAYRETTRALIPFVY